MKRGDIVTLKPYCKDRDRPALVLEDPFGGHVRIVFADTGEKVIALTSNLVLLHKTKATTS